MSEAAKELDRASLDVRRIRKDFPILHKEIRDKALVYLDNAASTQKPQVMIDALERFYDSEYANIHRGVYLLSEKATDAYEQTRNTVKEFINAADKREIVFTRSTTEAINLVAQSYVRPRLKAGDEIVITGMEHHSNIVPWQLICEATGATLKVVPINDAGEISLDDFEALLSERTRFIAVVHVSNVLGTINPVKAIVERAHKRDIPVLVDGAQAAPHMALDMQELGCDFYAFSGHKVYGPTGIGVLYGRYDLLEAAEPYQGGGDMIQSVTFEKTTFKKPPFKFEAGTPNIAATVALRASLDYLSDIGLDNIANYEAALHRYAVEQLREISDLKMIGTAKEKTSLVSFVLDGAHPHDVGTILDQEGIAIRAGHHCSQPVMDHFGVPATVRASFAFYNTREEIDALVVGLHKVLELLK